MSGRGKSRKTIDQVDAAIRILEEIQPASVRAVCYRLFTEKLIPRMDKSNTNMVSRRLVEARENNRIPWEWIVDETRAPESTAMWSDKESFIKNVMPQYRRDYWRDQPERVEVWSEKGTVRGTLSPVLDRYGVTFRVMHGYTSATAVNDVATHSLNSDKPLTALYVGDWDPSGMHMSVRDLPDRIKSYGGKISVVRVAIDAMDTKPKANVPHFPAITKKLDPRYAWFTKRYGTKCFEVDALSPVILRKRVEEEIRKHLDIKAWAHALRVEAVERESLKRFDDGVWLMKVLSK